MDLKEQLKGYKNGGIEYLSEHELDSLMDSMLAHIGSTDSELRDGLIYPIFSRVVYKNINDPIRMEKILTKLLDDHHLLLAIGNKDDDSVFTRSFSALIIAAIIDRDRKSRFLSSQMLIETFEIAVRYLKAEQDTRGYVENKGWAHSIAHGADLLEALVRHPFVDKQRSILALDAIHTCVFKEVVYINDEDYRLIAVLTGMLETGKLGTELDEWMLSFERELAILHKNEPPIPFYRTRTNVLNFLKSLYFVLDARSYHVDSLYLLKRAIQTLSEY